VRELLESSDARLAVTAVETGLLLGIPVARSACLHWASAGDPHALLLVALIGSEREQEVVFRALGEPSLRVAALRALGFVGTERAADAALPFLGDSDKAAARLAGETFAAITGWDLQPGAFAASDDDAGEIPGALPELDPVATSAWWKSARSAFAPGGRYLRGERRPAKDSEAFIAQLPMRLRNVVLLELALRKSRSLPVSTRSWAWQQQAQTCSLLG
jgi:hypothetical protein